MRTFEVGKVAHGVGFHVFEWVEAAEETRWIIEHPGKQVRCVEERIFRRVVRGESYLTEAEALAEVERLKGKVLDPAAMELWLRAWGAS